MCARGNRHLVSTKARGKQCEDGTHLSRGWIPLASSASSPDGQRGGGGGGAKSDDLIEELKDGARRLDEHMEMGTSSARSQEVGRARTLRTSGSTADTTRTFPELPGRTASTRNMPKLDGQDEAGLQVKLATRKRRCRTSYIWTRDTLSAWSQEMSK